MYVGLRQPRGDGERYVTPARAAAKETTVLSTYVILRQARATHLHMGVGLGISADYRTGSTPSSGKKSNTFTGHWSR